MFLSSSNCNNVLLLFRSVLPVHWWICTITFLEASQKLNNLAELFISSSQELKTLHEINGSSNINQPHPMWNDLSLFIIHLDFDQRNCDHLTWNVLHHLRPPNPLRSRKSFRIWPPNAPLLPCDLHPFVPSSCKNVGQQNVTETVKALNSMEDTLLETVPYPLPIVTFESMMFLFPRWDMWSFPGGYCRKVPSQKKCQHAFQFRFIHILFPLPFTSSSPTTLLFGTKPCQNSGRKMVETSGTFWILSNTFQLKKLSGYLQHHATLQTNHSESSSIASRNKISTQMHQPCFEDSEGINKGHAPPQLRKKIIRMKIYGDSLWITHLVN